MICAREASQHPALDEEAVIAFIERLATIARRSSDGLGSFSEDELSSVFGETCGFPPDDAARVLISRLPTLATVAPESGQRRFIDPDIADAARAGDLLRLIASPFDAVIHDAFAEAQRAAGGIGVDRLSYVAEQAHVQPAKIEVAVELTAKRGNQVASLDLLQLMMEWDLDYRRTSVTISDYQFGDMTFEDDAPDLSKITFNECIVEKLFVSPNAPADRLPRFASCLIGSLAGLVALGDLPKEAFTDCEIMEWLDSTKNNANILDTNLPVASKVLLTVLNKLFYQAGRGRRENALYRGLEPRARGLVPQILAIIEGSGFATPGRVRNQTIWFPKRDKGRRVHDIISHPGTSTDSLIERVRNL
jgi:hypothetical protein